MHEKFNESDREIDQGKKKKKTCKTYFRIFDQMIMKPLLIHNYQKVLQAKKNEFLMLIIPDEQEVESKKTTQHKQDDFDEKQEEFPQAKTTATTIFRRITQHQRREDFFVNKPRSQTVARLGRAKSTNQIKNLMMTESSIKRTVVDMVPEAESDEENEEKTATIFSNPSFRVVEDALEQARDKQTLKRQET